MEAPAKTPQTIKLLKKRELWEKRVSIQHAQMKSLMRSHKIYSDQYEDIKGRYQAWLTKNNIDPINPLN